MLLSSITLPACVSEDATSGERRYVLEAQNSLSQALDLDTGEVREIDPLDPPAGFDFFLGFRVEMTLYSLHPEGSLCAKELVVESLEQIPTSVDDCTWGNARLGFKADEFTRIVEDDAYLARTADDEELYQVWLVEHEVEGEPQGRARVVLEVAPAE